MTWDFRKIVVFLSLAITAFVICYFLNEKTLSSLLEKLIFNAVSILVGLSIAIIGIFLSSINTIYLSIYKIVKIKSQQVFTNEEIQDIKDKLTDLVDELKKNGLFSLYAFIIVTILFFIKEMDLPHVRWFINDCFLTKSFCINTSIMFGNFLIFWSIIDSMKVVFKITEAFALMRDGDE